MRFSPAFRALSLALALLFVGGLGGTSDLDALLYHRTASAVAAAGTHVESAGGQGCHAERCLLALRLASSRVAPTFGLPIRFEGIPQHGAGTPQTTSPRLAGAHHQTQSRAPPSSAA